MASSLFRGAVFAGPVISLAWMPARLHLHLSMSRWQDSANGNDPARPQGRYFHVMWLGGVRMPERATGGDAVADELFDLLDFRKAAPLLPRPDDLVINAHLKDATGPIRGERHGAELLGKRGQELLRHPAGPQAPAAQSAIGDLDHGADGHSCLRVRCVSALVSTSTDGGLHWGVSTP